MGGTLAIAAAMGVGLWYSINSAYYFDVTGVTEVQLGSQVVPVSDYRGIDADTSPLKMRACFRIDLPFQYDPALKDRAVPLIAPRGFDCFDAVQIGEDLQSGAATAHLAASNTPYGFDTFIAQYPDGRAYMWRQINKCGDAVFGGDDAPEGCPNPDEAALEGDIFLLPVAGGAPQPMLVHDLTVAGDEQGFHACFSTEMSLGLLSETFELADAGDPESVAPTLGCFDAAGIAADIASGAAMALKSQQDASGAADSVVAVYNDGRAYAWHQTND